MNWLPSVRTMEELLCYTNVERGDCCYVTNVNETWTYDKSWLLMSSATVRQSGPVLYVSEITKTEKPLEQSPIEPPKRKIEP